MSRNFAIPLFIMTLPFLVFVSTVSSVEAETDELPGLPEPSLQLFWVPSGTVSLTCHYDTVCAQLASGGSQEVYDAALTCCIHPEDLGTNDPTACVDQTQNERDDSPD